MPRWRVSAAWLTARHDCTPSGIAERCGGCCITDKWWPPAAWSSPDGRCAYLGPDTQGCTLGPDDKPVKCHLYPLIVRPDKRGLSDGHIVQHFRVTCGPVGQCKGNHGRGPMLVDALRTNFEALFGTEQYAVMRAEILAGRDAYLEIPDDVYRAYLAETDEERRMAKFPPRSERVYG